MADDLEKTGTGGEREPFEISLPNFKGIALLPLRELGRVVDVPGVRHVMHGADEIVPGMARGELADPRLVPRQIIHLEGQTDGELRELFPGEADLGDVFIELIGPHTPVVEIVLAHGGMVGKANLGEAEFHGAAGVFGPVRRRHDGKAGCACDNRQATAWPSVERWRAGVEQKKLGSGMKPMR